jgi:hypothetical protein
VDLELDLWICKKTNINVRELTLDDLFNIVLYYYPHAECCEDMQKTKESGCGYVLLDQHDENSIIKITNPTVAKVTKVLYIITLKLISAYVLGEKNITVAKEY